MTSTVAGGTIPIGPIPVGPQVPIGDPFAIAVDHNGNVFFTDTFNFHNIVRKLDTGGNLTIVAGGGATPGSCPGHTNAIGDGCLATEAVLSSPSGLGIDSLGNIYISDSGNNALREVTVADGKIHTIINNSNSPESGFFGPVGLVLDSSGNIFVSDPSHNNIIKVSGGVATIFASAATPPGVSAPEGLAIDASNNLYVANASALQILKINPAGTITQTFSLTGIPEGVAVDSTGAVYYTATGNAFVSAANNTTIYVGGGSGCAGQTDLVGDGCTGTQAILKSVRNGVFDSNNVLYVADLGDFRIRKVARSGTVAGIVTSVAGNGTESYGGDGGPAVEAFLNTPWGSVIDGSGNILFADQLNNLIRKVDGSGNISTFAGTPPTDSTAQTICNTTQSSAALGNGGLATSAFLCTPELQPPAFDTSGNLYFVDFGSEQTGTNPDIRKISTGGTITAVSTGTTVLSGPSTVAIDGSNNLFVADFNASKIYQGTTAGGTLTVVAGGGSSPSTCTGSTNAIGDGCVATQATLNSPYATIGPNDDIFIADSLNNRIRMVNHTTHVITTIAGTGTAGFNGDNAGTSTQLDIPDGLALDPAGNLLIADTLNGRVRLLSGGVIATLVGGGTGSCATATDAFGDGCSATTATLGAPTAITFNTFGDLIITDGSEFRIRKVVYLPIANTQTLSTPENVALNLTLAALSPRTGSTGFTFSVTSAANGIVTLNDATLGTITYTPAAGFAGADSFTFTANDGHATSASATITIDVVAPPTISKNFGTTPIPIGGTTSLTFHVGNPPANVVAVTGVAFTDNLPAGIVVSTPNGLTGSCGGGTISATAGSGAVSLSGTTLPVNTACTFSVNVTGTADGIFLNTTNAITSVNGGTGGTASDTLTVINPPSIAKGFGAATIPLNGTTSLTITLSSTNANLTLNGVAFTDNLPAGLIVATPGNLISTCSGITTAADGSSSVSLTGASLAPGASCAVSVTVKGTAAGAKSNSVQATSTNGGAGNTSNASMTVVGPPTISKNFNPTSIALNATTSLTFTIANPNTTASLTGIGFTDTLPTGLTAASGTSTVCGGTLTTTAPTGISLTGATIAATGTCQFSVTVAGATAGSFTNTTGAVTSNEGGTGNTASANLTVVGPPSIAKAFAPITIPLNGTSTLTFTVTNPAANTVAEAGVAFTDTLPTGLVVATPNGLTNTCGGTASATAGGTSISLTGGATAVASSCTVAVNVLGATAGSFTNTSGAVSSTNGGTGNTATANLTVIAPPSIVKLFNPNTIAQNATTSLQFTITNPTTNAVALAGVAFTDTLPTGLTVASSTATVCGGTLTTANPTGISLAGATVAASGQCQFSVTVTAAASGQFTNTTGPVTSTNGGTGNTASASLSVIAPPSIIKAFGATSIPLNGTTSLTFTIANPNTTATLTGIGFTDTSPTGLTVASGTSTVCGGTLTTTAPTAISLTGATIAAAGTCPFSVTVTGAAAGSFTNTTGAVSSTNGGTGNTASANLIVVGPPSIAKAFNPSTIAPNATTSLTFTITNPAANAVALAGVALTDTLPTGLTVASGTSTVCGGTLVTTNPTAISLTGATVAVNSQCQFSVTVTGTTPGQFTNTTGAVSATNGGTGNTATANLSVGNPPTVTKTFGATTIPVNGTTSLTISITNPNSAMAITGLAFTDTFPAGLVVAATPNLANTCGGTASAPAGATSVSLTAGTLAAGASCAVSLNVTSGTPAVETNVVSVTSTNSGNSTPASATLAVVAPATLIKSFGAATIPLGGSTSLSFTLQNSNLTQSLANVGFTDTLPTGLVVATPNGLTGSCGGGTITAGAGASAISLSGATLATSTSCTFSVNVTGVAAGLQNNTTGAVSSGVAGTGGTASANITVVAPPSIVKLFNPTAIAPNATTSLTFTITNPAANAVALAGVALTDTLPTGLTVASGTSTVCGGTLVTTNPTAISLTGATVAVNSQCQFSVTVTGTTPGQFTNTTGAVSATNGGTGNTATANLTVGAPPTIAKAFGATSIGLGASTSLTFTITNPNSALAFTGVAFTDSLPAGLDVSTPNGLTGTCGSGTVTAAAGSQVVTLAGGTIPGGGSCSFSVNVTGLAAGSQVNTTGNVSAANGGTGNTATASINVLAPDLTISKSHTGNFFQGQMGATYTITVSNVGQGPTAGTVTVTEVPPAGLTVTSLVGSGWTCTLGTLTCIRTDALAAGSSYPPITATVSVATNAPSTATNTVMVAGGGELNLANDTATDPTTITAPPDFTLTVAPPSETIRAGQTATFNLTITPVNNAFTSPITISAIGLPPKSQLTISSPTVTLGSNPTTISVVIMTTKGDPFLASNSHRGRTPFYAMLLPLSGLLLSGIGFRKRAWRKDKGGWVLLMFLLICCGAALNGCASASNFKNLGTTPGTYSVSIAATSGATQHAAPATLIVQP